MFQREGQFLGVTVRFCFDNSLPDLTWDLWRGPPDDGSHPSASSWRGYSFFTLLANVVDAAQEAAERRVRTENYAASVWDADITPAVDVKWCDGPADKEVETGQNLWLGQSKYPQDLRPRDAEN